jgi:transcriptional regulator with XRE-family HTH domain
MIKHKCYFVNITFVISEYCTNERVTYLAFYHIFEKLCKEKGVTPTQAGRENGIKQGTVSMWKKRGSTPNADTLMKLAEYFDCTPDYLLGKVSDPNIRLATQNDIDAFTGYDCIVRRKDSIYEKDLLEKYRVLPLEGRNRIDAIIEYDYKEYLAKQNKKNGEP